MASELESPDFDHKKLDGMINKFQDEMIYCFFQTETKVNIYRFFGKFLQLFQIRRVAAVHVNTAIGLQRYIE